MAYPNRYQTRVAPPSIPKRQFVSEMKPLPPVHLRGSGVRTRVPEGDWSGLEAGVYPEHSRQPALRRVKPFRRGECPRGEQAFQVKLSPLSRSISVNSNDTVPDLDFIYDIVYGYGRRTSQTVLAHKPSPSRTSLNKPIVMDGEDDDDMTPCCFSSFGAFVEGVRSFFTTEERPTPNLLVAERRFSPQHLPTPFPFYCDSPRVSEPARPTIKRGLQ